VTSLNLVDTDPAELPVDAVVIGVHSVAEPAAGESPLLLASGAESIAAAFEGRLSETLTLLGATGATGEVIKLATLGTVTAPLVVAVGLGPEPAGAAPAAEALRRGAGAAVRGLAGSSTVALSLPLSDGDPADGDEEAIRALRAIAEGALLGAYRFAGYKTKRSPARRDPVATVSVHVPDAADKAMKSEVRRALAVTSAVLRVRDWVNTAPNDLRPPGFAEEIAEAAAKAGLEVEVLDEKMLKKAGYGGIIAVGQGSNAPPRLVRLAYRPKVPAGRTAARRSGAGRRVALVGKGITFDSGGVSIKPAQGMWEMKSDMAGAAAVAATMLAVAALKPAVAVTAYLPLAENMVSGSAYRPGDVIRMYGGKHIEVLNTDAEGRMILADAITRAVEDEPDYLIETSTLTGGQVVALGKRVAGLMGEPAFLRRLKEVGDEVGEPGWPMPLPDDVRTGMDSDVADLSQVNAGMDRAGHMLQGGVFLSEFVPADLPWAHMDIAGPAYHAGEPFGYWTKGGTGVPVRTLVALIEDIAANG
jgi:leucyl aminopeptidase